MVDKIAMREPVEMTVKREAGCVAATKAALS